MVEKKRTPLESIHQEFGAKMVEFAGWQMPIQYPTGIMEEHHWCRTKAALFDVSHMCQLELRSDRVADEFETLVPGSITTLPEGNSRYTVFTNDKGGILDDLIVTNAGNHLFVVVNASRRGADIAHIKSKLPGVQLDEITDRALIAIQGPSAESVVGSLCPQARKLIFMESIVAPILGVACRVSRLGYTGEDGYEISIPENDAVKITTALLEHADCALAGLGARDTLRLEAGLCLYGNDIDIDTSPIEASLLWSIPKARRLNGGYPGAGRIEKEISEGVSRKLKGIRLDGAAPARAGVVVQSLEGDVIGKVTSGGFGPTVKGPIAMGYVDSSHSSVGDRVNLLVRGKLLPAEIVKLPFVAHHYKR